MQGLCLGILTNIQQLVKVYTLNENQQRDNQGSGHLIHLHGVAEGHISASWGLTNCGPLAKAPHSSTLSWEIPSMEEPGRLQSMGSLGVGHDWVTSFSLFTFMHWRRKWQPTPLFSPGESQGQRSLVGFHLWGRTESDTTWDLAAAAAAAAEKGMANHFSYSCHENPMNSMKRQNRYDTER